MRKTDRLLLIYNPKVDDRVWWEQDELSTFAFRAPSASNSWYDLLAGLRRVGHLIAYAMPVRLLTEPGLARTQILTHLAMLPFDTVLFGGCLPVTRGGQAYVDRLAQDAHALFADAGRSPHSMIPIIDNQPDPSATMHRIPARTWLHAWPTFRYEIKDHSCTESPSSETSLQRST